MRDFGDSAAIRRQIFANVRAKAQGIEPITNARHTLTLHDVDYTGQEEYSIRERKRAILRGETLGRRLQGTWLLTDNATGATIDRKRSTIATVPYMTDSGTFIKGGNEYTLAHQSRLRAGVFSRRQDNGDLEAHVNVMPGKGISSRVYMEPSTGLFRLKVAQAKLPLLPVLRAMGVTDDQLRKAWGNELVSPNMLKDDPSAIDKLYKRLYRSGTEANFANRAAAVADAFAKMELDPEVTKRTLGEPFKGVDAAALLATTKKLIAINRGEAEPDDRDHLAYMTVHGPEDLLAERLGKDRRLLTRMLWKAGSKGGLQAMKTDLFTKSIEAAIMGSGLGQPVESINPAQIFEQQGRVSRLGEGGIPSLDSVPTEARNVQPSHFGFIDPLVTPESLKVGVDSRVVRSARKGADGRLYSPFRDIKTGQTVYKSPQEMADATIAFPGELRKNTPMVAAMVAGRTKFVPREKIDYELPQMEDAFSHITNLVPMKSAVKGQRAVMAGRMITQALPVSEPESPLVQSGVPGSQDDSYENQYGRYMGAVRSDTAGTVVQVDGDSIKVRGADGRVRETQLYNNFPYNRKTFVHQSAAVKVGDPVQPGQLLARSNYTDAQGVTALGKNARVAYIPFRGMNFEDAIVVSASFAKRMRSEHMYQHGMDRDDDVKTGKKDFVSSFATKFPRAILDTIDDDGVVKPGTTVEHGHPLVLAVKKRDRTHGAIHRGRDASFADKSELWSHHSPGVVTDVEKTSKGIVVSVKSHNEMEVGDKLSGRYGDKGVIAGIIPDDEVPHDAQGRPYEVLLNPLGVITRTNPSQMVEASLGKIAERTGKAYRVQDFQDQDLTQYAIDELTKHQMQDQENIYDPSTGRVIPKIFTGNRFFMKLHHTAESKGQGRGTAGYTSEGRPSKGGETGSKRISLMDINALLSHGATEVLRDASVVRGQEHQDLWAQFMSGHKMPTPKVPFVHEKFVNQLKAAGINVIREGTRHQVMALTDADVREMSGDREVTSGDTVDWKGGLKPIRGGLFDEHLTGGHNGNRWAHIKLHEPMPNPVMEEPVRKILGLTEKEYREVLGGDRRIAGATGPAAIGKALAAIDVPKMMEQARAEIAGSKRGARDQAIRKLRYLKAADRLKIHPKDWMLSQVPVLPPIFRPVSVMAGSKMPMVADPNYLYKELLEANDNLKTMSGAVDDTKDERLALYDTFKAVTGLGDPLHPKNQEKQVKGILKHVFGNSPKVGVVQRKLLGASTDLVGRAVITPNPDLDMDTVGVPETRAWEVYKPFLIRRLVRRGVPRQQAAQLVHDKHQLAKDALLQEMEARPVIINRAPVLHRYGIMAFRPKLVKGDTLQVSPLIVGGFNADFDGDAMQYHVPASDEAVTDAMEKMLPSRNLLAASNFKVHQLPSKEYGGGLYAASTFRDDKRQVMRFRTKRDAILARQQGRIDVDQPVEILED